MKLMPDTAEVPGIGAGRRRSYRVRFHAPAMISPLSGTMEARAIVQVFDLSMFGVGFSSVEPLEVGQVFKFDMPDRRAAGSRIEVKSCRARADGLFDVGGEFC
jgi:hypothetical protein